MTYDKYYQKENLFGEACPELMEFFTAYSKKGKVLDLGCGQGRDAIALARLGYQVTGIDKSKVGIEQMNEIGRAEKLSLTGYVGDMYSFSDFHGFDIVLLDSMFHFTKRDRQKEIGLIQRILRDVKNGCLVVFCIQNTGDKVQTLEQAIDFDRKHKRLADREFEYVFEDRESGSRSTTDYRLIVVEK